MLVRDLRTGRLVMLPDAAPTSPRAYGMPMGYSDERLGLPFLAALPALAAKVLPIVSSVLPMLTGGAKGGKASAPPSPPPTPAPQPQPAPEIAPLPMPAAQTIAPEAPGAPVTATTRSTDTDTETVVAPVRVRQPNGIVAVVPMRVRRRRRRRVRTMRVAPPVTGWPTPGSVVRYPTY